MTRKLRQVQGGRARLTQDCYCSIIVQRLSGECKCCTLGECACTHPSRCLCSTLEMPATMDHSSLDVSGTVARKRGQGLSMQPVFSLAFKGSNCHEVLDVGQCSIWPCIDKDSATTKTFQSQSYTTYGSFGHPNHPALRRAYHSQHPARTEQP